jgi:hypothetical protein
MEAWEEPEESLLRRSILVLLPIKPQLAWNLDAASLQTLSGMQREHALLLLHQLLLVEGKLGSRLGGYLARCADKLGGSLGQGPWRRRGAWVVPASAGLLSAGACSGPASWADASTCCCRRCCCAGAHFPLDAAHSLEAAPQLWHSIAEGEVGHPAPLFLSTWAGPASLKAYLQVGPRRPLCPRMRRPPGCWQRAPPVARCSGTPRGASSGTLGPRPPRPAAMLRQLLTLLRCPLPRPPSPHPTRRSSTATPAARWRSRASSRCTWRRWRSWGRTRRCRRCRSGCTRPGPPLSGCRSGWAAQTRASEALPAPPAPELCHAASAAFDGAVLASGIGDFIISRETGGGVRTPCSAAGAVLWGPVFSRGARLLSWRLPSWRVCSLIIYRNGTLIGWRVTWYHHMASPHPPHACFQGSLLYHTTHPALESGTGSHAATHWPAPVELGLAAHSGAPGGAGGCAPRAPWCSSSCCPWCCGAFCVGLTLVALFYVPLHSCRGADMGQLASAVH